MRAGAVKSAHDVSEGGLACAVAECALWGGVGVSLDLEPLMRRADVDAETALFGEGPGGIVVSGPRESADGAEQRGRRRSAFSRSDRSAETPFG